MIRQACVVIAIGGALAGCLEPATDDASAEEALEAAPAAQCELYADVPVYGSGVIGGQGAWSGCTSGITTVVLRHDRSWWPDETLAQGTKGGVNGDLGVSYQCPGIAPIKVFTETRRGSLKVQSPRIWLPCD